MRSLTLIAISGWAVLAGCSAQHAVDPPDERGHIESPPPAGLDTNPAQPQSERPTTP